MDIVSIYNDKGGVGKTSLALEIGTALAVSGKKVLLIDNDPQGSLSISSTTDINAIAEGLDLFYKGEKDFIDILTGTFIENLILAPAGRRLKDFYLRTDSKTRERTEDLFDYMRTDSDFTHLFDFVIIDNPPTQDGIAMHSALLSDTIVIPVIPDEICYDALDRTYSFIEQQAEDFAKKYVVIVPSLVMNRSVHKRLLKRMKDNFDGANDNTIVSETLIKNRAEIPETIGNKQNLFISQASSEITKQLKELCVEIFLQLDRDEFLKSINQVADSLRRARWEKFTAMVRNKALAKPVKKAVKLDKSAKKPVKVAKTAKKQRRLVNA